MTRADDAYLEALALAHMLSPADSQEEDWLAGCLNAARDRLGLEDAVIDGYQKKACDQARERAK